MITFRAGAAAFAAVLALAGCSQEQQDWRAAEGAGTIEAYGHFLEQHPDSELATQARAHLAQLSEELAWQQAAGAGTIEGYREFLAQHPVGRRAEEARIRIEGFSLGSAPRIDASSARDNGLQGAKGVRAIQLADAGASQSTAVQEGAEPAPAGADHPGVDADAAAPAAAPVAAPDAAAAGFGVQLGAFGNPASATREWQRVQGRFGTRFGGSTPRIVTGPGAGGVLYRLQVPAADEAQARSTCEALKAQGQSCMPVLPVGPK